MKLFEVASIQMGQSPPGASYNTAGVGLPFFQGKAEFGEEHPTVVKWCSQPSRIAEAGDVLLSVRAPVGPTNVALERCCIGRGLAAIRARTGVCSQRYLRYFLSRFEADLVARGVGSTFTAINRQDIERMEIALPPIAEQERLASLLDDAGALRKLRAEAERRTEAIIPALFEEMFGNPEHATCPVRLLSEIIPTARPLTYGILKPGPDVTGGVPYVRVVDIKRNRLHVDQLLKTTTEIANQYRRSTLIPGDILVTIRGTVGRTCIVPEELKGANITQDTARVAVLPDVSTDYVVEFLNTPWAQQWMARRMLGQAVKGINLGDLRKLPVPLPERRLQDKFADRANEVRAMEAGQRHSQAGLDALYQSMLHRAFAGEL